MNYTKLFEEVIQSADDYSVSTIGNPKDVSDFANEETLFDKTIIVSRKNADGINRSIKACGQ